MFNTFEINNGFINNTSDLTNIATIYESSSFDSILKTKYGFKSGTGVFFNFNSICIENKKYGNILLSHDFDDIPEIDVYKYGNSLKHGGTIYDRRYKEKKFNISIKIISDSIENLEKEIRDLKSLLEIGGEFYKVEKENILKINIQLENIEVGRLILSGTEIKIKAISMDPFWTTNNALTIFNEGNSESFSGTLALNKTKIKGFVKHIIFIKGITGEITNVVVNLGGFPIKVNGVFSSGDSIIFDGINNEAFINGIKTKFYGQFKELEIEKPYTLDVSFIGTGTVDSFDLYNIYENKQL